MLGIALTCGAMGVGYHFNLHKPILKFFSISAGSGAKVDDEDGDYDLSEIKEPNNNNCGRVYNWGGRPIVRDEVVNKRSLYICRGRYALQYDPKIKIALWEVEVLNKRNFVAFNIPSSFVPMLDPTIPKKMQGSLVDYSVAGYQMSFLSPIENAYLHSDGTPVEILEELNRKSLRESLYLTNAVPETAAAARLRKEIDAYYRQLAMNPNYSDMYSISGPVFLNGKTKGFIGEGENKLAIPTHYYKFLTNPMTYGTDAYLIPNENNLGNKDNYKISINEIERLTGIEFFSNLASHYAAQVRQDPRELLRRK